jgi:hypothetical protein
VSSVRTASRLYAICNYWDMKKKLANLELITGATGIIVLGLSTSWWIALAVFLLTFSQNIHDEISRRENTAASN